MKKIFLLAVIIRLIYFFLIPPGQTPDEWQVFLRLWDTVKQSLGSGHLADIYYPNNEYYYPPLFFNFYALLLRFFFVFIRIPVSYNQAYLAAYNFLRGISLVISGGIDAKDGKSG